MTRTEVTRIKKAIQRGAFRVKVIRVGNGKNQSLSFHGQDAEQLAEVLENNGLRRLATSGTGNSVFDTIWMDR